MFAYYIDCCLDNFFRVFGRFLDLPLTLRHLLSVCLFSSDALRCVCVGFQTFCEALFGVDGTLDDAAFDAFYGLMP